MSRFQNSPFDRYGNLFDALHGLFPSEVPSDSTVFHILIDWKETPEAHVFKADLPGVKKEDVRVEVEDGKVLSIAGERRGEAEETAREECSFEWRCMERGRSSRFFRRFQLPDDAKVEEMKASMADGVLTLVVPKGEVKKPKVRSIEIVGGGGEKKGLRGKKDDVGAVCCSFWPH